MIMRMANSLMKALETVQPAENPCPTLETSTPLNLRHPLFDEKERWYLHLHVRIQLFQNLTQSYAARCLYSNRSRNVIFNPEVISPPQHLVQSVSPVILCVSLLICCALNAPCGFSSLHANSSRGLIRAHWLMKWEQVNRDGILKWWLSLLCWERWHNAGFCQKVSLEGALIDLLQ